MGIGLSGMISGLDTDSIVKAMVSGQTQKKTKIEGKIQINKWTNTAWSDLNKKIYSFYTDFSSKLRLQSTYLTNKATSSDTTALTATATNKASAGSHSVQIKSLASSQYVTGAKLTGGTYKNSTKVADVDANLVGRTIKFTTGTGDKAKTAEITIESTTTLEDITKKAKEAGISASFDENLQRFFFGSAESGTDNAFTVTATGVSADYYNAGLQVAGFIDTQRFKDPETGEFDDRINTYNELLAKVTTANLDDFDAAAAPGFDPDDENATDAQKEIYNAMKQIVELKNSVKEEGEEDATIDQFIEAANGLLHYSGDTSGTASLAKLGLGENGIDGSAVSENGEGSLVVVAAADAEAVVDGATIKSSSNKLSVNGLTMDLAKTTLNENGTYDTINVSVTKDTSKAYDFVKDALKSYNELLEEMDKLYNADSARKYQPLTKEQKEEMTDDEIEAWENKIKDASLRHDSTLQGIISGMRTSLQGSYTTKSGKEYTLSSFGIVSGTYTERGKLHLYGNADDAIYSTYADRLQTALAEDPDEVAEALGGIFTNLYTTLTDKCAKTSLSSALTFYNDKQYTDTLKSYEKQLDTMEDKIKKLEDRYYKQFTAMEKQMSTLQSQTNSLVSMLGGAVQQ